VKNKDFVIKSLLCILGMGRFNHSLKNDLKNVLKNREEQFRFFGDSFQYKNPLRLNRPNSDAYVN
jgi:hypothetical protein